MSTSDLSAWLGKSQTVVDRMDPGHAARIAVTLGCPIPELGAVLPSLWHWAFFLETVPIALTGTDGHPARGSFLPPADNRNRMWAGGRVNFDGGLVVGAVASVEANADVVASASAIFAGAASVSGLATVTAIGTRLGDNWTPVAGDTNTWTPVSADSNTWTLVSSDTNTWTPVSANDNTWTTQTQGSNTWLLQG